MKAAKTLLYSFVFMSFMLIGCGEAENTIEKPKNPDAPPAEEVTEENNSAVIK